MKGLVAALIGLAIAVSADPSAAYVAAITTSIPIASAGDDDQLKDALSSAIDDVLHHAIAFTPTVVTLQSARVVDDRIYILLLIADGDGEEMLQKLSAEPTRNSIEFWNVSTLSAIATGIHICAVMAGSCGSPPRQRRSSIAAAPSGCRSASSAT